MNFLGIGTVTESVGKIASALVTTDKERLELGLRQKEIDQRTDLAQMEINKQEAAHASLFVAGWRPAVGWVGVAALGYQFLVYPLLTWVWVWAWGQGMGWVPAGLAPPPVLEADQLWVVLSGILGIAGMRTYEKKQGVAR